jgi:hypothetical protein
MEMIRVLVNADNEIPEKPKLSSWEWWKKRRVKYNLGLITSGITAFICYCILGISLIMPHDKEFQITLFTIFFQGIGYLLMMLIANLFYTLGYFVDNNFNKDKSEKFRKQLFNLGFWFSCGLPFLIPIMIIIEYLFCNGGYIF